MGVSRASFHWADYLIFILMLVASISIGLYQSFTGGRQKTQKEYFLGNRSMHPIPVSLSLLMSFMSAILILGSTAEMYTAGTQWYMFGVSIALISVTVTAWLFVPLIHPLKLTSATEYLELRFKARSVKLLGTFLLLTSQILYMGVATYSPATALEAVTGFPVWASILCIGVVATVYTSVGGIKAVIWTDVFQGAIMAAGMLVIAVVGSLEVGGISEVWRINSEWDRLEFFNFDPDPTKKHTFWTVFIGGGLAFMGVYSVNQVGVQRYCSLPTVAKARTAVLLNVPGLLFLVTVCCLTGMVVFAYFTKLGCDPLANEDVANANQLLPYFMMKVLAYPGVPGIFVASLFAGALSTMSSSLNALSAATWEDALKWKFGKLSETRKTFLTKILVIVYGCIGVGMAFASKFMGSTVTQAAVSFYLTSMAPLLGLFLLGSLFPWANWIGALSGGISGLIMVMWISIGSVLLNYPSYLPPTATSNCSNVIFRNSSMQASVHLPPLSGVQPLYTVSYLWNPGIGICVTVVVGLIVSLVSESEKVVLCPHFQEADIQNESKKKTNVHQNYGFENSLGDQQQKNDAPYFPEHSVHDFRNVSTKL